MPPIVPSIHAEAKVAPSVTVSPGCFIDAGVEIEDGVFLGPNVVLSPRSWPNEPLPLKRLVVRRGVMVGANTSIIGPITIGAEAAIGAGSVVLSDVPSTAIVVGTPAHIIGYTTVEPSSPSSASLLSTTHGSAGPGQLVELPLVKDLRGDLTFGEVGRHLPFEVRRYFLVLGVPNRKVRGEHAHFRCHQFLVCTKGHLSVVLDDGVQRGEVLLDRPNLGLHIPPLVWGVQYKHSADAVLLVLASHTYDATDYIRDYDEFLKVKNVAPR